MYVNNLHYDSLSFRCRGVVLPGDGAGRRGREGGEHQTAIFILVHAVEEKHSYTHHPNCIYIHVHSTFKHTLHLSALGIHVLYVYHNYTKCISQVLKFVKFMNLEVFLICVQVYTCTWCIRPH